MQRRVVFMMNLFLAIFSMLAICLSTGYGAHVVEFDPQVAEINGSIKYTVIGRYSPEFENFKGTIMIDEKTDIITSVDLSIDVASINSNCAWCDRAVRSVKLLNANKYPHIIFKSSEVLKVEDGYKVRGFLEMHGVRSEAVFPFDANMENDDKADERILKAKGRWVFNRKDFNIMWSELLDHGGVIVGDNITVDWWIRNFVKN